MKKVIITLLLLTVTISSLCSCKKAESSKNGDNVTPGSKVFYII